MAIVDVLTSRIAEALTRCTHSELPVVAMDAAGLVLPVDVAPGVSKRDRVRAALEGKGQVELAQIVRRLGAHFNDFQLEELGLGILEQGEPQSS